MERLPVHISLRFGFPDRTRTLRTVPRLAQGTPVTSSRRVLGGDAGDLVDSEGDGDGRGREYDEAEAEEDGCDGGRRRPRHSVHVMLDL